MPRYDLMHWSQRVRDERAGEEPAVPAATIAPPSSPHGKAKPRAARPKPPRDEDAEHVLRLCREGRLFELQRWVEEGKPLTFPGNYRRGPLHVALDVGFHSLVEFLLQHERDQAVKDEALKDACWRNQRAAMFLALKYGANIGAVRFQDVIETWDRELVKVFIEQGADPVTDAPFARAFKGRVKAALGSFLDCRRARPELAEALQEQADMALRQACHDEDLKWVSLLMWLGANPRSKGVATDDLDDRYALEDPDYRQSALQIACASRKPEILRRLKPNPATDDLRELIAATAAFTSTPETVTYLVSLGADINDQPDGGSTALDTCLRHFGWKETVLDRPYFGRFRSAVPLSRLEASFDALRYLLKLGAHWTPDSRAITDVRQALYRVDGEAIVAVIDLLRTNRVCGNEVLKAIVRTPKMRAILAAVDRQGTKAQRHNESVRRSAPSPADETSAKRPLPPSRYDRKRLYDEVWAEPTKRVAQRYSVSDVAIAKACRLLDIPKPPRGYWAKKAAGHPLPIRPSLPDRDK